MIDVICPAIDRYTGIDKPSELTLARVCVYFINVGWCALHIGGRLKEIEREREREREIVRQTDRQTD